jgi:hypothetical protein
MSYARITRMRRQSWAEYERTLLLGGAWLPVTGCILFVHAPVERCVEILLTGVRGAHVLNHYGHPLRVRPVSADSLDELLTSLLPLEGAEHRHDLLVPTANPEWTAMLASEWRGQDPRSPMAWFGVAGVESVKVVDIAHTYDRATNRGFYGSRKIEMYSLTAENDAIGHSLGVRAVDTRRWEVVEPIPPFPVGNIWDPTKTRILDRFTHEHLVEMTALFGLRPFDEDFYLPERRALIVERTDPIQPNERTFTLVQARGAEPVIW